MEDGRHIVEIANMLVGNSIESKVINKVIAYICNAFHFDGAFVYEIDQYNYFNLKENTMRINALIKPTFYCDELLSEYRKKLSSTTIMYENIKQRNSDEELFLLSFFNVEQVFVSSIVDEKNRLNGLLILGNFKYKEEINEKRIQTLNVILSMLAKYIGVRVHQHKIGFAQITLGSILDNTGIDIYVNDFHTHEVLYVNRSMAEPYGGIEAFSDKKCWEVLFPSQGGPCEFCPQKKLIDEEGNPSKIYTWDYKRELDGSWFRVFSAAFRWVDGRLAHVVSSADITDNKRNEELVEYLANYDSLTDLPNRRMLIKDCDERINYTSEKEDGFVLFFDIDGFKNVNDTYGHQAGDELLIQFGEFFQSLPILNGNVYRNGGDEFVALIDGYVGKEKVKEECKLVHERFEQKWHLSNGDVFCGISIGISHYPEDGNNAEELISKADKAMYHIKKLGGGHTCFSSDMNNIE